MIKCQKTCNAIKKVTSIYNCITAILEKYFASILLLVIRLKIAEVFLKAGIAKIKNFESTLFLFEYEYAVPLIPFEVAAYMATFFEIAMPILLILGLFTRLAALPILGMAIVIQAFVYQNAEHYYWMILAATLITYGGGFLSLDRFLQKFKCKKATPVAD